MSNNKHQPDEIRAKVLGEVLEGKKSQKQIAKEHGLHPTTVSRWMSTAQKKGKSPNYSSTQKQPAFPHDRELDADHIFYLAEIGRLNLENDHLRKLLMQMSAIDSNPVQEKATDSKIPAGRFGLPFPRKSKV